MKHFIRQKHFPSCSVNLPDCISPVFSHHKKFIQHEFTFVVRNHSSFIHLSFIHWVSSRRLVLYLDTRDWKMNKVWSGFYSLRLEAEAQETVIADGACWWSWDGDGVRVGADFSGNLRLEDGTQWAKAEESQWCGVWVAASTSFLLWQKLMARSGWISICRDGQGPDEGERWTFTF